MEVESTRVNARVNKKGEVGSGSFGLGKEIAGLGYWIWNWIFFCFISF